LKGPSQLLEIVKALVNAVGDKVPVTVKMRSGFADTSLFEDNLWAVQVNLWALLEEGCHEFASTMLQLRSALVPLRGFYRSAGQVDPAAVP
jgi:hypothetical protein